MTRGKEVVEHMLNQKLPYTSGPQWLYENILKDKWVLAVSGTHGKTTTASILAWILEYAGMSPGFLIGGVPGNFGISARLGDTPFFVVEADEYDTAFLDIFPDLEAIKTQFHHLIRMVPERGLVVVNNEEPNINDVLDKGCWTPTEAFSSNDMKETNVKESSDELKEETKGWRANYLKADGSEFDVYFDGILQGTVNWSLLGKHNVGNAMAAIAAARHAGVPAKHAIDALAEFKGIKRRMELRGTVSNIRVYDDFAHHPTAIKTTLKGLRANLESNFEDDFEGKFDNDSEKSRIIAV